MFCEVQKLDWHERINHIFEIVMIIKSLFFDYLFDDYFLSPQNSRRRSAGPPKIWGCSNILDRDFWYM